MSSGMGLGGASRLDKSHHCPSLQSEGQEGGVWELQRYKSAEYMRKGTYMEKS